MLMILAVLNKHMILAMLNKHMIDAKNVITHIFISQKRALR